MRALGLMSGTSLDGIDAALVTIVPEGDRIGLALERFHCEPFSASLAERLRAALPPNAALPADVAALDAELGDAFARAALRVAAGASVDFAASHGLTVFHDGDARLTQQIGDPYRVRDALGCSVVFDFRRADCARGGGGAPLVPYADALFFGSHERDVVALNIGGIANVTVVERGAQPFDVTAWDTGPGNMLIDAFVRVRTAGAESFDRDGAHGSRGRVHGDVVAQLVQREAFFLALPPPKSTGRERFGSMLLDAHAELFEPLSIDDGCATLAAFTVATIGDGLEAYGPARPTTIASGGGTHNRALMALLRERVERQGGTLCTSDEYGIPSDAKEAMAFALLGYQTLRGRPASVPGATGAALPAVLGAIAPADLGSLLDRVRAQSP